MRLPIPHQSKAMDEGVEPPQRGLAAITGFKPDKHANAIHQNCGVPLRGITRIAPGDGVEPPLLGSEPSVLPLDDPGIVRSTTPFLLGVLTEFTMRAA